MNHDTIDQYLAELTNAVAAVDREQLRVIARLLLDARRRGATIYTLGNGGSASLASHLACDLAKNTAPDLGRGPEEPAQPRLRVISLSDNAPLITALGNDIDYADVFVEQLKMLLTSNDVVIAMSGSGASPNVVRAIRYAAAQGAATIVLTGTRSSARELRGLAGHVLTAPADLMEHIEDLHVIFNHVLAVYLREAIAAGG